MSEANERPFLFGVPRDRHRSEAEMAIPKLLNPSGVFQYVYGLYPRLKPGIINMTPHMWLSKPGGSLFFSMGLRGST
jgi:hypothetical protein